MSKLIELLKAFLPELRSHKDRADAYLSDAADIYDLERRMREIDRTGNEFCGRSLTLGMEGQ